MNARRDKQTRPTTVSVPAGRQIAIAGFEDSCRDPGQNVRQASGRLVLTVVMDGGVTKERLNEIQHAPIVLLPGGEFNRSTQHPMI